MTFTFDRETALLPLDENRYTIEASEVYRNPTGTAFGGWGAGIAAKAVEMHSERRTLIVSLQASYLAGIGPGEVLVSVNLLRSGGSTQFWRVELSQNDNPALVADIVSSNRKPTDITYQIDMPEARPPEGLESLHRGNEMAPKWVTTFDQKIAKGVPFAVNDTPEALVWIKEADGRPLDRINLFSICDTPMPRSFFLSEQFRPGSTVSMGTYIYASDEDLAAAESDYMLLRVDGATVRNSATDSRVELWCANGVLLAVSNQIGFFR